MNLKISKHMSLSGLKRHKCDINCELKAKRFLHRKVPQVLHTLILDTIKKNVLAYIISWYKEN